MTVPMFRFDPVEPPPEALVLRNAVRAFVDWHAHLMGFSRGAFMCAWGAGRLWPSFAAL